MRFLTEALEVEKSKIKPYVAIYPIKARPHQEFFKIKGLIDGIIKSTKYT